MLSRSLEMSDFEGVVGSEMVEEGTSGGSELTSVESLEGEDRFLSSGALSSSESNAKSSTDFLMEKYEISEFVVH